MTAVPQLKTFLAVTALALGLAACSSSSTQNNVAANTPSSSAIPLQDINISFGNVSESSPLAREIGNGVRSSAATAGIHLKSYNNIPDLTNLDPAQTLQNARLMVEDKPNLIIEYNGIQNIGASIGAQFKAAKIPCIAVNNSIPGCYFFNLSNMQMGIDAANAIAPIMKQKGWNGSNTVILLLQASVAGTDINNSVRYFYTTLAADVPGFTQVAPSAITAQTTKIGTTGLQVDGGAALEPSYTAIKNALPTIPASKHIVLFGINDDSVGGGWQAITQAHRAANSMVGAIGSSPASRTQLRTDPSWVVEGEVFPGNWGEYLIAMAVAIVDGATPPALTTTPQTVMTKATLSKYFANDGTTPLSLPSLSPGDEYLAKTDILQKFANVQGLT
jgi:ribose transport system substrate-binding protein